MSDALQAQLEALCADSAERGDAEAAEVLADALLEREELEGAASALDKAFGWRPDDTQLAARRAALLDRLAIDHAGLRWRFVPAGASLIGSERGDPDERPRHARQLDSFYISEEPLSWHAYKLLMGWDDDDEERGFEEALDDDLRWMVWMGDKLRLQYCENETVAAGDWHAHAGAEELFGSVDRGGSSDPHGFDKKPMVAVTYSMASWVADALTAGLPAELGLRGALPSEAQWEKAARGGLIGARFSWGDRPPTPDDCDCSHFGVFALRQTRALRPNGYGIYGMCGGVWEWTSDRYDALAYHLAAGGQLPPGADEAKPPEQPLRVLRGGSWADSPEACTVSFRMARAGDDNDYTANMGLRLVLKRR